MTDINTPVHAPIGGFVPLADWSAQGLGALLAGRTKPLTLYLTDRSAGAKRRAGEEGLACAQLQVDLAFLVRLATAQSYNRRELGVMAGMTCTFDLEGVQFESGLARSPVDVVRMVGDGEHIEAGGDLAWTLEVERSNSDLLARRNGEVVFQSHAVNSQDLLLCLDPSATFSSFQPASSSSVDQSSDEDEDDESSDQPSEPPIPAGPMMFVGEDSSDPISRPNSFPFARVHLTDNLLEWAERANAFCSATGAKTVTRAYLPARRGLSSPGKANQVDRCCWYLNCNDTSFWFDAKERDAHAFQSVPIDTAQLRKHLVNGNGHGAAAAFTRTVASSILVSGTEESFVDVVSACIPEFAAELTAATMQKQVASSLAAAANDVRHESEGDQVTPVTEPTSSAPRRRRMGV
jgi:hypothetical protein